MPNIFIATVSGEKPECVAQAVKDAIEQEWKAISQSVWEQRQHFGLPDSANDRFFAQVDRHLSISWMITPLPDDSATSYLAAYRHNGWHLDAVRQTRDFQAWDSALSDECARLMTEKDSLSGKEEALVGGRDFQEARTRQGGNYAKLFKHTDYLGAVAIIKRVWHLAYLRVDIPASAEMPGKPVIKVDPGQHFIRSIPAIAARTATLDDDEVAQEKTSGEKYIAAIAFDGDSIGKWVNGDFWPDKNALKRHHSDFSKALSNFALSKVREIVESTAEEQKKGLWKGQLIYAGGDDVVCLVPADAALEIAAKLREAFQDATTEPPSNGDKPDASAGIAIAHIHAPLQDLIRAAQQAEKRAKNIVGRPAFSITLMKRSGEISHWGSKWKGKGLELYLAIAERLKPDGLSAKFPHRVCQLLTPYLTRQTKLMEDKKTLQDAITDIAVAKDLIAREFAHAAERQGSKELARELARELAEPLRTYLDHLPADTQTLLTAVIDLCTTIAFADRTKPAPAEKQPTTAA